MGVLGQVGKMQLLGVTLLAHSFQKFIHMLFYDLTSFKGQEAPSDGHPR